MSVPARARELIRKHLDRSASETERAELGHWLVVSPEVAGAFAAAARFDAALVDYCLNQAGADRTTDVLRDLTRRPRRRLRWLVGAGLAAALLLALGAALFWRPGEKRAPLPQASAPHRVESGVVLVDGAPLSALPDGALFRVGDGPAVLRLSDGSRAELGPHALAVLHGRDAAARQVVELREGGGTFAVASGDGVFEVDTPVGRVTALGTTFSVALEPTLSQGDNMHSKSALLIVAVLVGLVQVDVGGTSQVLAQGEREEFGREGGRRPRAIEVRGVVESATATTLTIKTGGRGEVTEQTFDLKKTTKIVIDGNPGKAADLAQGVIVVVQLATREDKVPAQVRAEGPTISGLVKAVDAKAGTITLAPGRRGRGGEEDEQRTLKVKADAAITIDGKPGKLADLRTKEPAALRLAVKEKVVVAVMQGRAERRERGPRVFETRGIVESATATKLTVKMRGRGGDTERTFDLKETTKIVIDGKPGKAGDLAQGVIVVVQLAAPRDTTATLVRAEGPTIGGLVKAVDAKAHTITLATRGRGREPAEGEDRVLKVKADATIVLDGKPGKLADVRIKEPAMLRLGVKEKVVVAILQGRGRERGPRVFETRGIVESATATKLTVKTRGREGETEQTFDLKATTKVLIDGKPGKAADLPKGTIVGVQLAKANDTTPTLVRAEGPMISGLVKSVDAKASTITLAPGRRSREGEEGEDRTLKVKAGATISIDGKAGKLADVRTKEVAFVKLAVDQKSAVAIVQGRGARPHRRGSRAVFEIKAIDAKAGTITLPAGARETNDRVLKLAPGAKVMIDGKPGKLEGITPGARAVIVFSADGKLVEAIAIGGARRERER